MTEGEWLVARIPDAFATHPVLRNSRKRRLLACACVRRVLDLLHDRRFAVALEASEEYADGQITWDVLKLNARRDAIVAREELFDSRPGQMIQFAALCVTETSRKQPDWGAIMTLASLAVEIRSGSDGPDALAHERSAQCDLLRDVFGNPFRPVTFAPAWRTEAAATLATQMYESRDFAHMPILGDALEDARCDNDDVLAHCRDPKGTHVRGCWVVDLVLGKA